MIPDEYRGMMGIVTVTESSSESTLLDSSAVLAHEISSRIHSSTRRSCLYYTLDNGVRLMEKVYVTLNANENTCHVCGNTLNKVRYYTGALRSANSSSYGSLSTTTYTYSNISPQMGAICLYCALKKDDKILKISKIIFIIGLLIAVTGFFLARRFGRETGIFLLIFFIGILTMVVGGKFLFGDQISSKSRRYSVFRKRRNKNVDSVLDIPLDDVWLSAAFCNEVGEQKINTGASLITVAGYNSMKPVDNQLPF